jgi:hypothetical protein
MCTQFMAYLMLKLTNAGGCFLKDIVQCGEIIFNIVAKTNFLVTIIFEIYQYYKFTIRLLRNPLRFLCDV